LKNVQTRNGTEPTSGRRAVNIMIGQRIQQNQ